MYIFTQPSLGLARWRLSENLHCKSHSFLTKWCDLLDLSYRKKLWDTLFIDPRGVREVIALIFFLKNVFLRNTRVYEWNQMCVVPPCFLNVGGQIHLSSINDVQNFPGGIGGFEKRMQLCLPLSWTAAPFSPEKGIVCHSCRCRADPQSLGPGPMCPSWCLASWCSPYCEEVRADSRCVLWREWLARGDENYLYILICDKD